MTTRHSTSTVIECTDLGKCYQIYDSPKARLKQALWRGKKQYYKEFWALRNINFAVERGEILGIIGRNGSGKSTLLQLISGTLSPTTGSVDVHGRIAALLELGSGFNPEFTGRENVYLNASLLGLSKAEVDSKFDDIASFADIGNFIEQPVKTYSSGMTLRLAFAVQSQIDPDILIVDEALAVGDAKFQARCFRRLTDLRENGTSILLVTHSSEQVIRNCSRAILLDEGQVVEHGEPKRIINVYQDLLFGKVEASAQDTEIPDTTNEHTNKPDISSFRQLDLTGSSFEKRSNYNKLEYRWGDGYAEILDFCLQADNKLYPTTIAQNSKVILDVAIRFQKDIISPIFGVTIKTKDGISVYGTNTEMLGLAQFRNQGSSRSLVFIRVELNCRLAPGEYFISTGLASRNGEDILPHDRRYDAIFFEVEPSDLYFGIVNMQANMQSFKV